MTIKGWIVKHKTIIFLMIYFFLLYMVMKYIVTLSHVLTSSMSPAILPGDGIIIYDSAYVGEKTPQRGDIIFFWSDEYEVNMVKRVIGVGGDRIEFKDGNVYINDSLYDESAYLKEDVETNCDKTFIVPENSYFLLGDYRENSLDSRFWENPYITEDKIDGKVIFVFNCFKKFKHL